MHNINAHEPITGDWLLTIGMVRVNMFQQLYRHVRARDEDEVIEADKLEVYLWPHKEGGWVWGPAACNYRQPMRTQADFWRTMYRLGFANAYRRDVEKNVYKAHPLQASWALLAV